MNNGSALRANQALNCGMNTVILEWLMGHDIGIAKHYLADNIKHGV